jgi:hypothetical protein
MSATATGRVGVAAVGQPPTVHSEPNRNPTATTRVQRLARDAAEAAQVRAYLTDPDVVALRVERVRTQVDRLCWTGIVLGLAFTMTNVQGFAAAGASAWSLPWVAAWLLDPMVSLVLLAILRAEQVTARYQVRTGPCVRRAKWFTLAATYAMNTWSSYAAGSASAIVLHSVPPLVVFVAAEAITDVRDKLTEAVAVAFTNAATANGDQRHAMNAATHQMNASEPHPSGVPEEPAASSRATGANRRQAAGGRSRRKLFADYLANARAAWTPGIQITPAWIRSATSCSRGLSSPLATALAAELSQPAAQQREGGMP